MENLEAVRNPQAHTLAHMHHGILNVLEITDFRENSSSDVPRVRPCKTLAWLKLFLYPMDRAEVLHAQSYDPNGRRKNTPGENDQVNS